MYYTYIIKSTKTKRYYIGSTINIDRRLAEHNNNKNTSTKNRGPFLLIYKEQFYSNQEAYKRELKIKSYKGEMLLKS